MKHGRAHPSSVLRVVVGVWSAMGALMVGASSCSCGAGSQGDPHLSLAHGARADFRGRHGAIFNFLSAQNLSVNVLIENASFYLREAPEYANVTVHGTMSARPQIELSALASGRSAPCFEGSCFAQRSPSHRGVHRGTHHQGPVVQRDVLCQLGQ